jgi:hypothetical protein
LETRESAEMGALDKAVELLDELVTTPRFTEFLTVPGYRYLEWITPLILAPNGSGVIEG